MKFRSIITAGIAALSLGFTAAAVAGSTVYPPERINCLVENNKLSCEGFDHQYLVEDTKTADLDNKDENFTFVSGVAFADNDKASIFFTYRNSHFKNVKLKTTSTDIRPDLQNGSWKQRTRDMYVCKEGYMNCPIIVPQK
jgi:hypothetical protein